MGRELGRGTGKGVGQPWRWARVTGVREGKLLYTPTPAPAQREGTMGTGVAEAGGAGETLSFRKVSLSSVRSSSKKCREKGEQRERGPEARRGGHS